VSRGKDGPGRGEGVEEAEEAEGLAEGGEAFAERGERGGEGGGGDGEGEGGGGGEEEAEGGGEEEDGYDGLEGAEGAFESVCFFGRGVVSLVFCLAVLGLGGWRVGDGRAVWVGFGGGGEVEVGWIRIQVKLVNRPGLKRMSLTGICPELDELLKCADLVRHFDRVSSSPAL
jgi:hypothetical protein